MAFTTAISAIELDLGSRITIPDVSWQAFESILQEQCESRRSRIAYSQNTLEVMAPLPDHERSKILISDIVKTLLRHQSRDSQRFNRFRNRDGHFINLRMARSMLSTSHSLWYRWLFLSVVAYD